MDRVSQDSTGFDPAGQDGYVPEKPVPAGRTPNRCGLKEDIALFHRGLEYFCPLSNLHD